MLDLYIGDAPGALAALEHYKELTGEDKPVTGWIAELRQRTGKKTPPPAAAPPSEPAQPSQSTAPAPAEAPAPAQTPDKAGG